MSNLLPSSRPSGPGPTPEAEVTVNLRDGTRVQIRPIRRSDVELERLFIEELSARSRRFRFLDSMSSPSSALLRNLVEIDAATDVAYVAIVSEYGRDREIGVARFSASPGGADCEFAVTVSDAWQRRGLGTRLMQRLVEEAKARGMTTMHSLDSADNEAMRGFAKRFAFRRERMAEDATQVLYSLDLTAPQLLIADDLDALPCAPSS